MPDPLSLDDALALIKEYADATDERGPHAWFFALCWALIREFFDLLEEIPDSFVSRKSAIVAEFSGLTEFANEAIRTNSTDGLTKIANRISVLLREVVALRKQKFQ